VFTVTLNAIIDHAMYKRGSTPATSITDPGWVGEQIQAAARRYQSNRRTVLGVLWWYSASSALLGPPVESLVRTGVGADPALDNLTLYLHPDGMVLDAVAAGAVVADVTTLGQRIERTLSASIDAVAAVTGAGRRALWAIATDSLASRVLWAGGRPALAGLIAAAVGQALPAPRFEQVAGHRVVRRASCCLIFQVPTGQKCASCPRQLPADRRRRLLSAFGQPTDGTV
jgi:hypothetical protein